MIATTLIWIYRHVPFFFDTSHLRNTSSSALASPDSFPLEDGDVETDHDDQSLVTRDIVSSWELQ